MQTDMLAVTVQSSKIVLSEVKDKFRKSHLMENETFVQPNIVLGLFRTSLLFKIYFNWRTITL